MPLIPRSDQETRPETYIVADLRVDVGRQCVSRGDIDIALPNLSFRLLVALIQEAPNVVSYDRLMELAWPGQVVSPETVNKRANLLREALGDNAKEARYISGVRSRGYRLVAEVTRAERVAAPLEVPAPNTASTPPRIESSRRDAAASETQNIPTKRTPKLWLGFSVFLVVVLAVGLVARTILRGHRSGVAVSTQNPQPVNAPFETHAHTVAVLPRMEPARASLLLSPRSSRSAGRCRASWVRASHSSSRHQALTRYSQSAATEISSFRRQWTQARDMG